MARFRFNLASYLSIKEKIEEQKKLDYGKAIKQLELEKQKKERLLDERRESIVSFRESIGIRITPFDLQVHNNYLDLLKKRIKEQERLIILAEKFVEEKRLELVEAMRERKMLEKLKEKAYEDYLKEEQLAEQKVLDEVASYQYNNRDRD